MSFDPYNFPLKIRKSIETPTPKVGAHLGVWGFIPSHFPTFLKAWNVTPRIHSWPTPLQALALVVSSMLRLRQSSYWRFLVPYLVLVMVDRVGGCIVLVAIWVVSGATWMFSIVTFTTMESTSIAVMIPFSALTILVIPNLIMDIVLARERRKRGGRTKLGKMWA